MGNAIRYSDDLYDSWGQLETALRDNRPVLPPATQLGDNTEKTRHFVYGMHNRALGLGQALVELVHLDGCQRLLDVGGGPGTYSALLTRRYPGLYAQVLDLPEVVAIAEEIIASMQANNRVTTLAGDYHTTPWPAGQDAVLISGVLHRETPSVCRELITRARDCLTTDGQLITADVFTDTGGVSPAFATLFGLNMLLTTQDGGVHADAEVAEWMRQAGFTQVTVQPFPPPMPHRVVMGVKA
jgi:cyclopropane fatty-acyl-phospholipid synthase-like methyltransferase